MGDGEIGTEAGFVGHGVEVGRGSGEEREREKERERENVRKVIKNSVGKSRRS